MCQISKKEVVFGCPFAFLIALWGMSDDKWKRKQHGPAELLALPSPSAQNLHPLEPQANSLLQLLYFLSGLGLSHSNTQLIESSKNDGPLIFLISQVKLNVQSNDIAFIHNPPCVTELRIL
jgi:hypothetical protein